MIRFLPRVRSIWACPRLLCRVWSLFPRPPAIGQAWRFLAARAHKLLTTPCPPVIVVFWGGLLLACRLLAQIAGCPIPEACQGFDSALHGIHWIDLTHK